MDVSGISLNRSTFEERWSNIGYLRKLYFFFVFEMLVALAWSLWVRDVTSLGDWVYRWWGLGLAAAIVSFILIVICTFLPAARSKPLNYILYAIFVITWAYMWGQLCAYDQRRSGWDFLFFWLCLFNGIAIALFLHAW
jgi:FtsH-binding integral membrane protein